MQEVLMQALKAGVSLRKEFQERGEFTTDEYREALGKKLEGFWASNHQPVDAFVCLLAAVIDLAGWLDRAPGEPSILVPLVKLLQEAK
jgi:hypothetical protein